MVGTRSRRNAKRRSARRNNAAVAAVRVGQGTSMGTGSAVAPADARSAEGEIAAPAAVRAMTAEGGDQAMVVTIEGG